MGDSIKHAEKTNAAHEFNSSFHYLLFVYHTLKLSIVFSYSSSQQNVWRQRGIHRTTELLIHCM